MDSSPSTCKDGGQAANDNIGCATSPDNDVGPRQDVRISEGIGNAAAVRSKGDAMQMADQRTEEEQYEHDENRKWVLWNYRVALDI